MNRSKSFELFSFCFMVLIIVSGNCFAALDLGVLDRAPAPWRTDPIGQSSTTFQSWQFTSYSQAPENSFNSYGDPFLTASSLSASSGNRYHSIYDYILNGVWQLDDGLSFVVPNDPDTSLQKNIHVQLIYSGAAPRVYVSPSGGTSEAIPRLGLPVGATMSGWFHATYQITLSPGPISETIHIMPAFNSSLYLDGVIIETQCIPEPFSALLLGVGACFIRCRKTRADL